MSVQNTDIICSLSLPAFLGFRGQATYCLEFTVLLYYPCVMIENLELGLAKSPSRENSMVPSLVLNAFPFFFFYYGMSS